MVLTVLTLRADKTVVRGFGMGDRCSFLHMALIELVIRKNSWLLQTVANLSDIAENLWVQGTPWILQPLFQRTKVFLSISSINAMSKNEHLSPIPKPLTSTVLSAQGVKITQWFHASPKCYILRSVCVMATLLCLCRPKPPECFFTYHVTPSTTEISCQIR